MAEIRRTRNLRSYLGLLVLLGVVPMLLMGILALAMTGRTFRNASQERLLETAEALSHAVDNGIANDIATLRLISLMDGDQQFHGKAEQVAIWASSDQHIRVMELEARDKQLASVYEAALNSHGIYVSNLLYLSNNSVPQVAIAMPIAGTQSRVVAMLQNSNRLIDVLHQERSDGQELLVAVVDANGHIAARSRSPDAYLGKPVPDWNKLVQLGSTEGLFRARTKEGGMVVFAFRKLANAPGWALVVGQPADSFDSGWNNTLRWLVSVWSLTSALVLFIALRFSKKVSDPMKALVERSRHVINDAVSQPIPVDSSIREIYHLQQSLGLAEKALHARAEQLRDSERLYRTMAEASALVIWRCNENRDLTFITGWQELTGQSDDVALQDGLMQRTHPDDVPTVELAWRRSLSRRTAVDVEFRVKNIDDQWQWLRCRGAENKGSSRAEWVGVLEDADARRKAQDRIAYLAQHDALTGLANRSVLNEHLHAAVAVAQRGQTCALLCLDLDRFKEVNDTLGHPVGDALLIGVSERLKEVLREGDLMCRLGGDEFAMILSSAHHPSDASHIADRIIESLNYPFELKNYRILVGVSVGIVMVDKLAQSPERLMQNVDLALYRAKSMGRGCYSFFEQEMDTRMQARRRLELELHEALERGEFVLHYQPIVMAHNGQIIGCEALLRWEHPVRGILPPSDFIELAEEIGLMIPIGEWVTRQACQDASGWPEGIKIAVNLSSSQLAHPELHRMVESALSASGLPPSRLELEITENALMAHIEAASATLLKLKILGISVVMDDFGTGQSSLGYLRAFPFSKVKIDKSFVNDLGEKDESEALISAISNLCKRLGIATTIEGVETHDQFEHVRATACTEVQGFLFGKPVPIHSLYELFQAYSRDFYLGQKNV